MEDRECLVRVGFVGGCREVLVEVSLGENGSLLEREDGSKGKVNLMDWQVERSFKSAVFLSVRKREL